MWLEAKKLSKPRVNSLCTLMFVGTMCLSACGAERSSESSTQPVSPSSSSPVGTVEERAQSLHDEWCPASQGYGELHLEQIHNEVAGSYSRFSCISLTAQGPTLVVDLFEDADDMDLQLRSGVPCLYDAQYRSDTWMIQASADASGMLEAKGLTPTYCQSN